MKKSIAILLMFATLIFLLPFSGLLFSGFMQTAQVAPFSTNSSSQNNTQTQTQTQGGETQQSINELPQPQQIIENTPTVFKIYNESTGQVDSVSARDYTIGAVAAEMPMSYPDEALKAQAVASLTYAVALKQSLPEGDASIGGAHFAANPSQRVGYMNDEAMQSFWGEAYTANKQRIEALVDSLDNKIITYESAPIHACYHAISAGKTQASANVWGEELPYLISVDSPFDITSPDYNASIRFSVSDMQDALAAQAITAEGEPSEWFGAVVTDEAGYVQSISVNGVQYTGTQIRDALALRSPAFNIAYTDSFVFEITTQGYGHGVGMSQFGANCMALTGNTHEQILQHYFPNTQFGFV